MLARNLRLLAATTVLVGGAAALFPGGLRGVGNHAGFAPAQPIAFSHRLHAGELEIQCLYCHGGAERSRHAGIPEASLCMNCHRLVTAPRDSVLEEQIAAKAAGREPRPIVSAELAKLYGALGLDSKLEPDPALVPRPIEWTRVHRLPDFVYFDHRPHVLRGLACETCHGPVQSMERVRQESDLSMGWCVNCHRQYGVEPSAAVGSAVTTSSPEGVTGLESEPPSVRPVPVSTDCASCHF
jgi:hypothetical protein